ncbi:MAG: hypothetical protein SGARI_003270, partial [Bacillariaceae sp.]
GLEKHHAEQEQSESLHHEPDIPPENNGEIVHQIANLKCDAFGGPSEEKAQEMVYWEDIPQDAEYMSPFHRKIRKGEGKLSMTQFLTFEPDHVSSVLTVLNRVLSGRNTFQLSHLRFCYLQGGWNNIRMAMGM